MPAKKVAGTDRIEIRCEPWFADLVGEAAKKTDRSVSSYVRQALQEQMIRDGMKIEKPVEKNAPIKRLRRHERSKS